MVSNECRFIGHSLTLFFVLDGFANFFLKQVMSYKLTKYIISPHIITLNVMFSLNFLI